MTLVPPNSGSPVQVASVSLSSAQVLSCFTTAVTVVPAAGPGVVIIPVAAFVNYTFVTTAYTDHGGSLALRWGQAGFGAASSLTTLGFWTAAASQGAGYMGLGNNSHPIVGAAGAGLANLPLVLQQDTANPTLGDGTLTATILYSLVTAT